MFIMLRTVCVWLEQHVRKRLENSLLDQYVCSPAKKLYCDLHKQY